MNSIERNKKRNSIYVDGFMDGGVVRKRVNTHRKKSKKKLSLFEGRTRVHTMKTNPKYDFFFKSLSRKDSESEDKGQNFSIDKRVEQELKQKVKFFF